jgi:hypothetical protein
MRVFLFNMATAQAEESLKRLYLVCTLSFQGACAFFKINMVPAQAEESLKRLYGAEYCSQQETLLIREEQH